MEIKKKERSKRAFKLDLYLTAAMLVAAFLYLYGIWDETYANTYYTTAVGSMLQSWHNFFYGSLDSAGSVTVDKPPLVFWIQAAFAYVLGLHAWSVILPQALAGIGSVLLVYLVVKPTFGLAAARAASFGLALMPVAAAVSRTNNIDAMLVFTLLLAVWFLLRGIREQRTGSLLAAFSLIGAAFNMKMLQAYMVLPAFYLFYLLAVRFNWKRKLAVLAGATALMLAISVSWAVIVDSVSADKRPYIGSSTDNSVLQLAFGYNGISRLTGERNPGGQGGGVFPGGMTPGGTLQGDDGRGQWQDGQGSGQGEVNMSGAAPSDLNDVQAGNAADGQWQGEGFGVGNGDGQGGFDRAGGMGGAGMFNTGTKGPLRLFQNALGGQASWLLPFALIAALSLLISWRRKSMTAKHKETLFWLAWLVPASVFFSIAGFFHQYYLIMLAPPIAALAGAGWNEMWSKYRQGAGWQAYLLPVAVAATAGFQWWLLRPYEDTIGVGWSLAVAMLGLLSALALAVLTNRERHVVRWAAVGSLAVLLIGPAYWSATPIVYGQNSTTPAAGPDGKNMMSGGGRNFSASASGLTGSGSQGGMRGQEGMGVPSGAPGSSGTDQGFQGEAPGQDALDQNGMNASSGMPLQGFGGMGETSDVNAGLLAYLKKNQTTEYLLAVSDYSTAAPYIVKEHEKVVILHGFQNTDPVYDTDKLEQLVKSGKVKYFLVGSMGMGGGGGREGSSDLTAWIQEHGKAIDSSEYNSTGEASGSMASGVGGSRSGTGAVLYEVTLN